MSTLERAIVIATEAYAGDTDQGGAPYILHPLRVMLRMETEDEMIVAVLHEVCEDHLQWLFGRLVTEGFSYLHAATIDILTRRKGQSYAAYIEKVARDPLAVAVKLADLAENLDLDRPSTRQLSKALQSRYKRAQAYLREVQARPGDTIPRRRFGAAS